MSSIAFQHISIMTKYDQYLQPRIRDIARLFCNDLAQMMRKLVNTSCWKCERRTAVNPTWFYTLVRLALTCACFGIWDLHCPHEFVDISWQVTGRIGPTSLPESTHIGNSVHFYDFMMVQVYSGVIRRPKSTSLQLCERLWPSSEHFCLRKI